MSCRRVGSTSVRFEPRLRPSRGAEMALPFFCQGLLEQFRAQLGIRIHLLEATVLLFELLDAREHRGIHAAEFASPLIKGSRANGVLTAQSGHRRAALGLLEHRDNLAVGESRFFHGTSSENVTRK